MWRVVFITLVFVGCRFDHSTSNASILTYESPVSDCRELNSDPFEKEVKSIFLTIIEYINSHRSIETVSNLQPEILCCNEVDFAQAVIDDLETKVKLNIDFMEASYLSNRAGIYGILLHEVSHLVLNHNSDVTKVRELFERQADVLSGILFSHLNVSDDIHDSYKYLPPFRNIFSHVHADYDTRVNNVKLGYRIGQHFNRASINNYVEFCNELERLSNRGGLPHLGDLYSIEYDYVDEYIELLLKRELDPESIEDVNDEYPDFYEQLKKVLKEQNIDIEKMHNNGLNIDSLYIMLGVLNDQFNNRVGASEDVLRQPLKNGINIEAITDSILFHNSQLYQSILIREYEN